MLRITPVLLLALVACGADSDGDGLSNREEANLGSDPNNPDTDGDGLTDGEEMDLGTAIGLVDSDGDLYEDGWEIAEGTDPTDSSSRIYEGFWPYNPDKSNLQDVGFTGSASVGQPVGRFIGVDQHGDMVDMWDFLGHGKPVIIDISAQWCPPCQATASWVAGGSDPYELESEFGAVRAAVDRGDIYWVTLLSQNNSYGPATQETSEQWDAAYYNPRIPVLAAPNNELMDQLGGNGFPNFHTLDSSGILRHKNGGGSTLDFGALTVALSLVQ